MSYLVRGVMGLVASNDFVEKVLELPELSSTKAYELVGGVVYCTAEDNLRVPCHLSLGNKVMNQATPLLSRGEVYSASAVHSNTVSVDASVHSAISFRSEMDLKVDGTRGGLIEQPVLRISADGNAAEGTLIVMYTLVFDDFTLNNDVRQEIFESQL